VFRNEGLGVWKEEVWNEVWKEDGNPGVFRIEGVQRLDRRPGDD